MHRGRTGAPNAFAARAPRSPIVNPDALAAQAGFSGGASVERDSLKTKAVALTLALAAVSWWVYFRLSTGIQLEDALITYRYAVNLARGDGMVFNPGEPVLGTSSVSHALMLAGFAKLFGEASLFYVATCTGILFSLGAGRLLFSALRRVAVPPPLRLCLLALFWFHPDVSWTTVGGMETPQVLFLMAASLWAWLERKHALAGLACGALLLGRPDGAVWVALLGLWVLLYARAHWLAFAAPIAATYGVWVAYGLWAYGTPIPHSLIAKSVVVQDEVSRALASNLAPHSVWFASALGDKPAFDGWAAAWSILLCVGIGGAWVAWSARWRAKVGFLALYPFAMWALFWVGRAPRAFRWYLLPVACVWMLLAIFGSAFVVELVQSGRLAALRPRLARAALVLAGLLVAVYFARANAHTLHRHRAYQRMEDELRRTAGLWLAGNTPEDASIAMEAIGYQGFYSRRRVIDLAGLVSPQVVEIRRRSHSSAQAFDSVLRELEPDYVLLRSFEIDDGQSFFGGRLFEDGDSERRFFESYAEVQRFESQGANTWGPLGTLTLYQRRGA